VKPDDSKPGVTPAKSDRQSAGVPLDGVGFEEDGVGARLVAHLQQIRAGRCRSDNLDVALVTQQHGEPMAEQAMSLLQHHAYRVVVSPDDGRGALELRRWEVAHLPETVVEDRRVWRGLT
jgi:hypothetical protein